MELLRICYKINDPINSLQESEMNFASGNAFTNSLTYSQRGFGVTAEIHRTDNMLLLSERDRTGKAYIMNYIPTLNKTACLYPFSYLSLRNTGNG